MSEMTVKEAIEFCSHMANKKDSEWETRVFGELLEVLKRGEAYEKMWHEVFANYKVAETDNHYSDNKTKNKIKLKLEQKYLKEAIEQKRLKG